MNHSFERDPNGIARRYHRGPVLRYRETPLGLRGDAPAWIGWTMIALD